MEIKMDLIIGTNSGDLMDGYDHAVEVQGLGGNDQIRGSSYNDVLKGSGGNDMLSAGAGNDVLNGGAGNDILFGDAGNDRLLGGRGDDYLAGGSGNDILYGGAGADVFVFEPGGGNDIIRDFNPNEGDRFEKGDRGFGMNFDAASKTTNIWFGDGSTVKIIGTDVADVIEYFWGGVYGA